MTEVVCALDACDRLVGRDMTSQSPASVRDLPDVGYFRKVGGEGVLALEPDLALASSQAGPPSTLDQLRSAGVEVVLVPDDPGLDVLDAKIAAVAAALDVDGAPLRARVQQEVEAARARIPADATPPKVLLLYSRGAGAVFTMGAGTTGHAMLELAGGANALDLEGSRPVSAEAVIGAAPDVVLLPKGSLEAMGGEEGLFAVPGLASTPAGANRRFIAIDDLALLGFGPRTGAALGEIVESLHPAPEGT